MPHRMIEITGSDDRLDLNANGDRLLNALPRACDQCGFPDLDHVPQPYLIRAGPAKSPNEASPAENGNFLVRERVKCILEIITPGACAFYPTQIQRSDTRSPWWLAVPQTQRPVAQVDPKIPRCPSCNQPKSAHPGSQYVSWSDHASDAEIDKSSTWASSELGWDRWISRMLYCSVRLFNLLNAMGVKGLDEATCSQPMQPDEDEAAWIQTQLQFLEEHGIPMQPPGAVSPEDLKWFKGYLKNHTVSAQNNVDIKAAERRLKIKLPKSYVNLITKLGPITFQDVDDQPGLDACILAPEQLVLDQAVDDINPLTFAHTGHGDTFCFNVQPGLKEYAVHRYNHEFDLHEPYAPDFPSCIRRFVND